MLSSEDYNFEQNLQESKRFSARRLAMNVLTKIEKIKSKTLDDFL